MELKMLFALPLIKGTWAGEVGGELYWLGSDL